MSAASFYAIGWILLSAGPLPLAKPESGRVGERVRAGIAYIREMRTLRRLLIAQGAAFVFFAAVIPVEVIYAKQTLDAGDAGYGLLLGSWGVGMVLGSIVFAALRRVRPPPLVLQHRGGRCRLSGPGRRADPGIGLPGFGGRGNRQRGSMGDGGERRPGVTAPDMQARVMSVLESIGAAMPGIGYVLGGLIASGWEPRATFLFAGIGVLATVAVATPCLGDNGTSACPEPPPTTLTQVIRLWWS